MNSNDHGTELQDLSHRDDRPLLDAFRENIFTKSRLEVPTMSTSNEIFSGPDQVHALFYRQSLRWLGTIVYAVFLFITLRIFQIKGNSDPAQEILFNFLKIALSLLMASNLNVSQWVEEEKLSHDSCLCRSASKNLQGFCDGNCEHGLRKVRKWT